MKFHFLFCSLLLCTHSLFSQADTLLPDKYTTAYEKQVIENKSSSNLDLFMAMGEDASQARTGQVKDLLDGFISEMKSAGIMRMSEEKQMKKLHAEVHTRFLKKYKPVSPFPDIFITGQYNCVSASALFALILDELDIPYAIQVQPQHVYIMAYPDTKAISVEMTAKTDAYSLPARKDISKSMSILLEYEMTTKETIKSQGEMQVYNSFFNTNSVVDLKQLAGIQYFNEVIIALNETRYTDALADVCKTEKLYNVDKTMLMKTEVLLSLIIDAKFDRLQDVKYLIDFAKLEKSNKKKVYYQYGSFIQEQLVTKGKKELADSSYALVQTLTDSVLRKELSGLYFVGMSEHYSHAYNLRRQTEYAVKAYNVCPDNTAFQLWLIQCITEHLGEKNDGSEFIVQMDVYAKKYPFLQTHNRFLMIYFYGCSDAARDEGRKYLDLGLETYRKISDAEVIDEEDLGMLFAETAAYYIGEHDYAEAKKVLQEGLKMVPGHERLIARMEIVESRME